MKRILFALMVLGVAGSAQAGQKVHDIKWGDTLTGIAHKYLGRASQFKRIAELNEIKGPEYRIFAGRKLFIPDSNIARSKQQTKRTASNNKPFSGGAIKATVTVKVVSVRLAIEPASLSAYYSGTEVSISIATTTLASRSSTVAFAAALPPAIASTPLPLPLPLPSTALPSYRRSYRYLKLPYVASARIAPRLLVRPCDKIPTMGYTAIINAVTQRIGLDPPCLVHAVIQVESGFNPAARSPRGAMGLMQLMPQTVLQYGVGNPFDVQSNIEAGTLYLHYLIRRFGSLPLALAAYNAGPMAVEKFRGVPPYRETRRYIKKVLSVLHSFGPQE